MNEPRIGNKWVTNKRIPFNTKVESALDGMGTLIEAMRNFEENESMRKYQRRVSRQARNLKKKSLN